ncbi:hypothetical protein B0J17DRAFT_137229 [Rhizoctonia solani]|nr:hypothetical protein B0J17DRAFT_137229 [Rhizoctonia solani]
MLVADSLIGNIIEQVSNAVDHILIDPNGEWHTKDGSCGTSTWMSSKKSRTILNTCEDRGSGSTRPIMINSGDSDTEVAGSNMITPRPSTETPFNREEVSHVEHENSQAGVRDIKRERVS